MTADQVEAALPQHHKETLQRAGRSIPAIVAWILAHGCDLAPVLRKTIPINPWLTPGEDAAILAILDIVCPPVASPATP